MQVRKYVKVIIDGKASKVKALFDAGSSFTVMGYKTLEKLFGEVKVNSLTKPREVVLVNGMKIVIDGYVDSKIIVEDYMIEDRIYLSKDVVEKVMVEGRELYLPDLIIGAPTMETWGIELDLKRGDVVIRGGAFLL